MGLRDFFTSSNDNDKAVEAVLILDLSHNQSARSAAVDALNSLPTEAVRAAATSMPDTKGREVAQAVVVHNDRVARDEAHAAYRKANRHH